MEVLPRIGTAGLFEFAEPFSFPQYAKVPLECIGVRSLRELLVLGNDPYVDYYEPVGLSRDDFILDLKNEVSVLSLQDQSGLVIFVPQTYLKSSPEISGVLYTPLMIGIKLIPLPESMSLSSLRDILYQTVVNEIGVAPVAIKTLAIGNKQLIPHADHELYEKARQDRITNNDTLLARIRELESNERVLLSKIQQLEKYIRDNYVPPEP